MPSTTRQNHSRQPSDDSTYSFLVHKFLPALVGADLSRQPQEILSETDFNPRLTHRVPSGEDERIMHRASSPRNNKKSLEISRSAVSSSTEDVSLTHSPRRKVVSWSDLQQQTHEGYSDSDDSLPSSSASRSTRVIIPAERKRRIWTKTRQDESYLVCSFDLE